MTTAFWDAYLRGDARALEWLKRSTARKVLEPDDRWQLMKGPLDTFGSSVPIARRRLFTWRFER
jgi:hypothetical protein